MKKRILSLLIVLVLLVSLMPVGALAGLGDTTIKTQPKDVSVDVGDTATFTIEAENANSSDLKYIWFDISKVNTDNITSFGSFIDEAKKVMLSDKPTLELKVTSDMDGMTIRCAVYYESGRLIKLFHDLTLSDEATINIKPE